ncbi:hemerythrin domain-containing protein [Accumulibacter sp.]|uniref:bacteriohemerythrin n=1 Tax=Accumulibacter sp. TaxID=2053492 RepID=UPI00262DE374|nr:hemerythrin domain-containing protein [Accumulibacter sp.]
MSSSSHRSMAPVSGLHNLSEFSLKQLVAWGDHLKVHQPQIDAQHEAIFKLALEIAHIWQDRGDLEELKALAERLSKILVAHFRYEEQLLTEIGYPELAVHKAEHQQMLDELQVILDRLHQSKSGTIAGEPGLAFQNYVLGLTVGHIFNSDMDYCLYARKAAKEHEQEQVWPAS